ncbi:hypothetical protein OROGR_028341 [Orobanche gracilis]
MMSLKNKFSGLFSQMTRLFDVGDDFGEDDILGKLEGMKDVIEQVNNQFKDPDLTTFVCVCIPEFLSLYETERLVQELTRFEIDTHNIIINQVIFDEEVVKSKLLKARMQMQQKYLDQFYVLYDDFHITKLPLLPQEVYASFDNTALQHLVEYIVFGYLQVVVCLRYFCNNLQIFHIMTSAVIRAESSQVLQSLAEARITFERSRLGSLRNRALNEARARARTILYMHELRLLGSN